MDVAWIQGAFDQYQSELRILRELGLPWKAMRAERRRCLYAANDMVSLYNLYKLNKNQTSRIKLQW